MESIAEIVFWIILIACILSLTCLCIQDAKSYHESKLEYEKRKEKIRREKLKREHDEKYLRQNWMNHFNYLARIERREANSGYNYEERKQKFEKTKSYIESLGQDYYEFEVWRRKRDYEWDKEYGKYREK